MGARTDYWREYCRRRYRDEPDYRERCCASGRKYWAGLSQAGRRKKALRAKLRRAAREEARERHVPVTAILTQWGASP